MNAEDKRKVVLLTGMSGAGLSTALKCFEDMGYEAVDNLRLGLVLPLMDDEKSSKSGALAIAIDTRNANFSADELLRVAEALVEREGVESNLIFLECSDEALQRRFTETRRRHPLAVDRPVADGIKREREIMWKLRDSADHVIDTSQISVHDLKRILVENYRQDKAPGLSLFVTSFSYRHGVPRDADLVIDARFLKNPHWDVKLRPLTGQDGQVVEYIKSDADFSSFMENLSRLLLPLLPRYQQEGKSYLTIAIGCTGGKHRSVMVAEQLATILAVNGYIVSLGHRDLERQPAAKT